MNEKCYLCNTSTKKIIHKGVRDNSNIDVLKCNNCGLVYLSEFAHIDKGFYENSNMHKDGKSFSVWLKQTESDDLRRYTYIKDIVKGKNVLDFGSGNGGFLNLIKDQANNILGVELENAVEKFYELNDIPITKSYVGINDKFDYITLFHVLEHLSDPIQILKDLSLLLEEDGEIIIEVPNADDALLSLYDLKPFKEFTYWSCHLFLFNIYTLELLVRKAGLKLNYVRQVQRYSLANHLHWLAKGKPGGQNIWSYLDSDIMNELYSSKLTALGKCDTLLASISKEEKS